MFIFPTLRATLRQSKASTCEKLQKVTLLLRFQLCTPRVRQSELMVGEGTGKGLVRPRTTVASNISSSEFLLCVTEQLRKSQFMIALQNCCREGGATRSCAKTGH